MNRLNAIPRAVFTNPSTTTLLTISIRICLAACLFLSFKNTRAQSLNEDSIKTVIRTASHDSVKVDAMLNLASFYIDHKMDDSAGLKLLKDGRQLAEKAGYAAGICQALLIEGNYYRKMSNWSRCIQAYEAIKKQAGDIKDSALRKKNLLMMYNNLASIYNINGDFTSSLDYRFSGMQILESTKPDYNRQFIIYTNIASDYRQLDEYDKASEYLARAARCVDSAKPYMRMEYWYEREALADDRKDTLNVKKAIDAIDSCLKVIPLSNYQRLDYGALYHQLKGDFDMRYKKDYVAALPHLKQALELAVKMNSNSDIVSARFKLGRCYGLMGNSAEAIRVLGECYALALATHIKKNVYRSADLLTDEYEKRKDIPHALKFLRIAYNYRDSLVSEEKLTQLNFLEAKYQNARKENEIAQLKVQNVEKELTLAKRNRLLLVTGISLIALLILIVVLYRINVQRQVIARQKQQLQQETISALEKQQQVISLQSMINGQETERTRVARDLHDGLGGLFSTVKMHFSTLQHEMPQLQNSGLYKRTYELVDNASDELRKIAHNMMPEVLMKLGLAEALKDFCDNINAGRLLKISLQVYGMEGRLGGSTEVMLFRIIQELINNIIKHASATEAIIQINKDGHRLSITVEDNGRGFDMKEAEERRNMGMETVKSRVSYLNGKLSIDSRKDVGTTIMIDLLVNEG